LQEDSKSIEDFENNSNEEEYQEEEDFQEKKQGLSPELIANTVAEMTGQYIEDEEERKKYQKMYINTSVPLLKLIDFEDLTAGADLSELPPMARGLISIAAIAGPAVGGMYMFAKKEVRK